jgi:hypothetical protein
LVEPVKVLSYLIWVANVTMDQVPRHVSNGGGGEQAGGY